MSDDPSPYSSAPNTQYDIRTRKIPVSERDEILRRYLAGESSELIARDYGVRGSAILFHVKKAGFFKDRISSRRAALNESAFDELSQASAYWLGFLMADGCISDSGEMSLALSYVDRFHVWRFRAFLGSDARTPVHTNNGRSSVRISIRSKRLCAAVSRYGVLPRKTYTAVALGGIEDSGDFWRGMVDGDGSLIIHSDSRYRETKGSATISLCGTEGILEQFRAYLKSRVPNVDAKVRRHSENLFNLSFGGRTAVAVSSLLYSDASVALPRKEALAKDIAAWGTYERTMSPLKTAKW